MANEKIVNRENLKAFREKFQDKLEGGQIIPSKSLQTKSIEAVSEESGSVQDTPFINQGTGTANGTASVDTSPVGKQLEKQGNSVVVNQWVPDNQKTYSNTQVDNRDYLIFAIQIWQDNSYVGELAYIPNQSTGLLQNIYTSSYSGNKIVIKHSGGSQDLSIADFSCDIIAGKKYFVNINIISNNPSVVGGLQTKDASFINFTQWFNGDIPQDLLDHPENFFRYYNGPLAYNTGSLETSDGRYLVCGGRNVWDEETELGAYNGSTGQITPYQSLRSKSDDYIKVIPNTDYYAKSPYNLLICFYDKDKNFISSTVKKDTVFKTPSNALFIRFGIDDSYGTTYKHDITISLYYATGDGYDQYYAYEQPKVYDTGTEVLRSAGSVKDYKTPDGTIHRLVGSVDLGTLDWTYSEPAGANPYFYAVLSNIKNVATQNDVGNLTCSKYIANSHNGAIWTQSIDKVISTSDSGNVVEIVDKSYNDAASFKTAMSGVYLYYELATPTTEQGTPFSENIEINDYGTMGWLDTNNAYVDVPQGCKIFYPADYVLFLDSLGQRVDIEWDPLEVASKTQLNTEKTALQGGDTQLKNAIGGTLRHCLCVKESLAFNNTDFVDLGTLDWLTTSSSGGYFYASFSNIKNYKSLCSKYMSYQLSFFESPYPDKAIVSYKPFNQICIRDTSYTDATTLKNSLKGVLLAYEKA